MYIIITKNKTTTTTNKTIIITVFTEQTTLYSYEDYENGLGDYAPTNFTDVQVFSQVFLSTLYSLVFALGFIGRCVFYYGNDSCVYTLEEKCQRYTILDSFFLPKVTD